MKKVEVTLSQRLDVLLAGEGMTRSQAAKWIRAGHVRVNEKVVDKPSFVPETGDKVEIDIPEPVKTEVIAQDIPIQVLYEDSALAVVVKPCGMVVHPAAGNPDGTLVNALLHHLDNLSGIGGEKRPGIVHRLDKDTSGILLVAKHDRAHVALSRQLAARTMDKHYVARVAGGFREDTGEINAPIARSDKDRKKMAVRADGREAITRWRVLARDKDSTLLDVHLITGRTHQIRVHMASTGHPIWGDQIYGGQAAKKAPRLMLHAAYIAFDHPVSGQRMAFTVPADAAFRVPEDAVIGRPPSGPSL